jgi:putative flippase GtrA
VRFACTGCIAGLIQLAVLDLLLYLRWEPLGANIAAFLLAAQVNFLLSYTFTWHDRHPLWRDKRVLLARWLTFHLCISGTALLNMLVFLLAHTVLPVLVSSALGIVVAASANFLLGNHLVFRLRQ